MCDEDDSLFAFNGGEIVGAFLLEGGVANGENFIKEENVAFGANSDGKGETNLHAGGIILEFLVHELTEFGEIDDFVVHGIHFFVRKA